MGFYLDCGWGSTGSEKTQIFVIPRRAARRGISLSFAFNHREIPRFARNDKIKYFFRSLSSRIATPGLAILFVSGLELLPVWRLSKTHRRECLCYFDSNVEHSSLSRNNLRTRRCADAQELTIISSAPPPPVDRQVTRDRIWHQGIQ